MTNVRILVADHIIAFDTNAKKQISSGFAEEYAGKGVTPEILFVGSMKDGRQRIESSVTEGNPFGIAIVPYQIPYSPKGSKDEKTLAGGMLYGKDLATHCLEKSPGTVIVPLSSMSPWAAELKKRIPAIRLTEPVRERVTACNFAAAVIEAVRRELVSRDETSGRADTSPALVPQGATG
jgi:hypothetical protein